ncbi:MAG: proton-conducting transporter membrane subunit [Nitrospinales bacterium]
MSAFLASMAILIASGVLSLMAGKNPRLATALGAGGSIVACMVGLAPTLDVLLTGAAFSYHAAWSLPYASFSVGIDALSAVFLLTIFVVCPVTALYGSEYLLSYGDKKNLGAAWFHFNMLIVSMAMVVVSANGILFIINWEIMAITSYFLVTFTNEYEKTRSAGFVYLVSIIVGALSVMAVFILLGGGSGTLDFAAFGKVESGLAAVIFVLALIGFGAKAGFVPLHPWLPDAHGVAPIHIHAMLSGVMIKMGIYGFLRITTFLGPPPVWWGVTIIILGLLGGLLGIIFAASQHNIKRLLAYCSVEGVGVITLGLGFGFLGISLEMPTMAVLGFAGGLFHVFNHSLFKGLLMMGMGTLVHATHGVIDMDKLGGALKKMPVSGVLYMIGCFGIIGLPPFNGFISEFLIYMAAFDGIVSSSGNAPIALAAGSIAGLGLIGGLAAVCCAKSLGAMFLGEPRTEVAKKAHEPGFRMRFALIVAAVMCLALGLTAPLTAPILAGPIASLVKAPGIVPAEVLAGFSNTLSSLIVGILIFLAVLALCVIVRPMFFKGKKIESFGTWDCGYAAPTTRIQYTSSSFSQSVEEFFWPILRGRKEMEPLKDLFPKNTPFKTSTPDVFIVNLFTPVFSLVDRIAGGVRWFRGALVNDAVLYIVVASIVLLVISVGF